MRIDSSANPLVNNCVAHLLEASASPHPHPDVLLGHLQELQRLLLGENLPDAMSFEYLYEHAPDMLCSLDATGRIVRCNETLAHRFGGDKSRVLGKSAEDFYHASCRSRAVEAFSNITSTGVIQNLDVRLVLPDGSVADALWTATVVRNAAGEFLSIFSSWRDITVRRHLEQQLAERERHLRTILETEPACVKLTDEECRLIEINAAGLEMVEVANPDVLVGKSILPLIKPEYHESFRELTRRVFAGETGSMEFEYSNNRGKSGWLDSHASPLRNSKGQIVAMLSVTREITERKLSEQAMLLSKQALAHLNDRLEQRVAERTRDLQQSNHDLEVFSHSVAHDLRAPVRAMFGFAKALNEDCGNQLDATGKEYVHAIETAAKQMDELIQDLLKYSVIGRGELMLEPVDIDSLIVKSLQYLELDLTDFQAHIHVHSPLGWVWAHRNTLLQVVNNLISNAMKFVAPGVEPEICVFTEVRGGTTRLWVEDNGIGIDTEHQSKVFQIFERLHSVETYPGTGVGLAIVRRGMEAQKGSYGVLSTPGRGSRFWIELRSCEPDSERQEGCRASTCLLEQGETTDAHHPVGRRQST